MKWSILQDVEKDLDIIEDIVYPEDVEEVEEVEEVQSIPEKILTDFLHLDDYERSDAWAFMGALSKILEHGNVQEWYNIGALLIYLSEHKGVAYDLEEYLSGF
jgi:hypothetical protein